MRRAALLRAIVRWCTIRSNRPDLQLDFEALAATYLWVFTINATQLLASLYKFPISGAKLQAIRELEPALTAALKAMKDDPVKVLGLVGLSFAYGVFHAAGPGHGKAVISSYMIANETELKRGIAISLVASLAQGLTAILLVGAAYLFLRGTALAEALGLDALRF